MFFVLYNGRDDFPDQEVMKLSDAFEKPEGLADGLSEKIPMELELTVININKGRNRELIDKSPALSGYVELVSRITRNLDARMTMEEAVTGAVRGCIADGVLKEYLLAKGSEVENMLIQEWDTKAFTDIRVAEALMEGRARERVDFSATLKDLGVSPEIIAQANARLQEQARLGGK